MMPRTPPVRITQSLGDIATATRIESMANTMSVSSTLTTVAQNAERPNAALAGGLYLAYLTYTHFAGSEEGGDRQTPPKAKGMLGLTPFWATVVRVELINLAFSIDSILVAVAMSPKTWVVVSGGILGIVAMRLVVGRLLVLVERYPALVDGAFIIIGWVAIKLVAEYAHAAGFIELEIPHWASLIVIVIVLAAAYLWGRIKGPMPVREDPELDEP